MAWPGPLQRIRLFKVIFNFNVNQFRDFFSWAFLNPKDIFLLEDFYYFFGLHDCFLIALGVLIYNQIRKSSNGNIKIAGFIILSLLFFLVFPFFASFFEAQRRIYFEKVNGELIESFNLAYTFFRFPTYWILGPVILIFLNRKK